MSQAARFSETGTIRRERSIGPDGAVVERELVKVTFTYDDRIADGIYCGRAIDLLKTLVEDPTPLESPPELDAEALAALALLPETV